MLNLISQIVIIIAGAISPVQQSCQVNKYELKGKYTGDCVNGVANGTGTAEGIDSYTGEFKKGWPHGEGTYTYSNNDVYVGSFKKGLRHGKGELRTTIQAKDTVIVGRWRDDDLIVQQQKAYEIVRNNNIDKVVVSRVSESGGRVEFVFMNPRGRNSPDDIRIISDSGSYNSGTSNNNFIYEIDFPVYINLQYSMTTGLGTSVLRCILEMKIYEPGSYRVVCRTQ
ncbi:MAG: hypothetical protein RIM99_05900 [Cyclobacteriaceae bacterium]